MSEAVFYKKLGSGSGYAKTCFRLTVPWEIVRNLDLKKGVKLEFKVKVVENLEEGGRCKGCKEYPYTPGYCENGEMYEEKETEQDKKWRLFGKIIGWFFDNDLCGACETNRIQYKAFRELAKILEEEEDDTRKTI